MLSRSLNVHDYVKGLYFHFKWIFVFFEVEKVYCQLIGGFRLTPTSVCAVMEWTTIYRQRLKVQLRNSLQVTNLCFHNLLKQLPWSSGAGYGSPFSEENMWKYTSLNVSSLLISVICHLPAPMDIIDKVRVDIPKNIRSNSHCKFKCYHPIQYVHNIVWYSYFSSIILM